MRLKSLFCTAITLALILAAFPAITNAVTSTLSVSPATSVYDPPETFTINIDVSGVTDLASWEVKLRFDNMLLDTDPTWIVEGPFLKTAGSTNFYANIGPSLDYITVGSLLSGPGGASGSGTLASVTFKVVDTGSCALHLYDTKLYNSALSEISHATTDGQFHTTYYRPVAMFDYSPSPKAAVGEPVTFNASDSYDADGTIISYTWDFGDLNVTTTNNPIIVHTYVKTGTYIVTLTVTDDDSPPNTDSKTSSVKVVLPGDANEDGKVDWKDLLVLARAYGSKLGEAAYVPEADFNGDGKIDWKDLLVLARNYGRTS